MGDLLYNVKVDRLSNELVDIEMEVESHEDVFISAVLVREGDRAPPGAAVALAVDEADELGGKLPGAEEIRALAARDEHQFMWQGYVASAKDGSGMCDTKPSE